uniref:Uncharacterized protein n=1 Tax=Panagrolaimus sp. JU765 TaxID=591449 RepID=A0AC34QXF9_9BILA
MWNFGKFYDITVYQEIYLKSSRSNKGRKLVCDSLNGKYWKYTCDECKSGETVAVYSPNHKILLGYKYNEHTCGKVKRPENVIKKMEKKPFVPKTTSSELLPVTDDLWILPCNENNVAKHYFYIISSENNKYASKFILEEKKSGDLVYICEKCQLNGQTVYATINITAGHILVDAANNHIVDCFEVNLKKALKIESGILTNY